jgi:hypothetical protein
MKETFKEKVASELRAFRAICIDMIKNESQQTGGIYEKTSKKTFGK